MECTVFKDSGVDITRFTMPQATSSPAISKSKTHINDNCSSLSDLDTYWEHFNSSLTVNCATEELIENASEVEDSVAPTEASPPDELKEIDIEISDQSISENPELNLDGEPTPQLEKIASADEENATATRDGFHEPSKDSTLRRSKRHPQPLIEYWTNKGLPRKPLVLTFYEHARKRKPTQKEKKMRAKSLMETKSYERYLNRINKSI